MTSFRLLVTTSLVSVVLIVSAQLTKMNPFDFHVANVILLQDKRIQKEIGITEKQRALMNRFANKQRQELQHIEQEYVQAKKDPRQAAQDPRTVGYFLELKQNVLAQLTPGQLHRLGQISVQAVSTAALQDAVIAKQLGISDSQLAQERQIYKNGLVAADTLQQKAIAPIAAKYKPLKPKTQQEAVNLNNRFRAEVAAALKIVKPQVDSISRRTETKMIALLTPSARRAFDAVKGKKFNP